MSSGLAEHYARYKLKSGIGGGEGTAPVTTARPEAGKWKCVKTKQNKCTLLVYTDEKLKTAHPHILGNRHITYFELIRHGMLERGYVSNWQCGNCATRNSRPPPVYLPSSLSLRHPLPAKISPGSVLVDRSTPGVESSCLAGSTR